MPGWARHYTVSLTLSDDQRRVSAIQWDKQPIPGTMLSDPGVYCLRTNETSWDEATLWRTYMTLTDLEAVFRSLKSELGLRPIYHHKEHRCDGHLFISVLACQCVQLLRCRLTAECIHDSWATLRTQLNTQCSVTARFRQRDGRTLHIHKTTQPDAAQQRIYHALGLDSLPGKTSKLVVDADSTSLAPVPGM